MAHLENMPLPEGKYNPADNVDQAPIHDEQIEKLKSWAIDLPRSARAANSIISYIEAASGMNGKDKDEMQKRIDNFQKYQSIYPIGTLIKATYRDNIHGRWVTDYGKVVDWYARSFDERLDIHHKVQEKFSRPTSGRLAPFKLVLFFRGGNIEDISMSNINKIKDITTGGIQNNSPEGVRKLR